MTLETKKTLLTSYKLISPIKPVSSMNSYGVGATIFVLLLQKGYVPSLQIYNEIKKLTYMEEKRYIKENLMPLLKDLPNRIEFTEQITSRMDFESSYNNPNMHDLIAVPYMFQKEVLEDITCFLTNLYINGIPNTSNFTKILKGTQFMSGPLSVVKELPDLKQKIQDMIKTGMDIKKFELFVSLYGEHLPKSGSIVIRPSIVDDETMIDVFKVLLNSDINIYKDTSLYSATCVDVLQKWLFKNEKEIVPLKRKQRRNLFALITLMYDDLISYTMAYDDEQVDLEKKLYKDIIARYHASDYVNSIPELVPMIEALNK